LSEGLTIKDKAILKFVKFEYQSFLVF